MDREKYIELYSSPRIDSYSSIDEHEANFEMLGNIAPRLSVRVDFSKEKFYYFNIKPNMIIQYLDDILQGFDKELG